MQFETVLKKTSALFAAMVMMITLWSFLHLPGASLPMVTFAFLSSAALCDISSFNRRVRCCIRMVCGAAAAQFLIGITAAHPAAAIIVSTLFSFFILAVIPERQNAIIVLITGFLSLSAPSGVSAILNRCIDIGVAGIAVLTVTTAVNAFNPSGSSGPGQNYTFRQAAVISAEIAVGVTVLKIFKHGQLVWVILTVLFIHLAETAQSSFEDLVKQRIFATPLGILAGGLYLGCFNAVNYRMIYIVPFSGTAAFFMLYLKNNYFIFTFLFMFTLTVFTDWMLGTNSRFHFTEIMFTRCAATAAGALLLLCGKNFMRREITV